ncbi:hypothetical protein LSH36_349g00026 [Paralvinella palmiformis]|uniref:Uncharacterized protein n=1 Tax=Paralvinella palmiformis TaxID=53620 RepID=A0AAD9N1Q6_9ANNE|nr:hypothetical protein LSH36_349g00026 [Paralvinella palmiformis]
MIDTCYVFKLQSGIYWLELMSYYSSGWSLVLIGLCEAMVFSWVYSAKRLMKDIETMTGSKLYMHWWVCWSIITPLLLIAILIFNIIDTTPISYGGYQLPSWAQTLGWLMAVVSVVVIPIFMIYEIVKSYKDPDYEGLTFGARICKLTKPNRNWKPSFEKEAEQKLLKMRALSDKLSANSVSNLGNINTGYDEKTENKGRQIPSIIGYSNSGSGHTEPDPDDTRL